MQATRALAKFLRPYWHWALLAPLLMVVEVAMDLLQPWLIERIIDDGVATGDLAYVLRTGGIMIGVAVLGMIGGVGCTIFAVLAAQGFGADLRQALYAKIQTFSFANLDELDTGALITRLTSDVTQVQELVLMMLRIMVRSPLLVVGGVLMAVLTSARLALLFLVLIPAISVLLVVVIRKTFPIFGGVQVRLDALNIVMQENLAGVRVVKAFVRAAHENERFRAANEALKAQTVRAVRTMAVTMPMMMLLLNVGIVAALWFGGLQVQAGEMQVGQIVAFINYLMQALSSLVMLSMLVMRISRAEASAVRIGEVLATKPRVPAAPQHKAVTGVQPLPLPANGNGAANGAGANGAGQNGAGQNGAAPPHRGRVAFEHVTFRYREEGEDAVLRDISFTVKGGQTVALLGATGSGKSTLVHLVPRFYDVSAGRITIDGVDVRDLDERTLRATVGVALQESVLFGGTIRDNIAYGRPDATDAEVETAARLAQAHDFIMTLPGGYETAVEQRGVNLSGGQKQRLAIARALLVNPLVLLLDDSMSAVDVETEARLQAALATARAGRTNIIVAQRISSVLGADRILVLEDGGIAAAGTHAELLAASPIYREIYSSQLEKGTVRHDA
jgi:ATP-binding cassette subfamily B protein